MATKTDKVLTGDEIGKRLARLEGTEYAHGTLIKALDDHMAMLTRMIEVQSQQIVELKRARWTGGN